MSGRIRPAAGVRCPIPRILPRRTPLDSGVVNWMQHPCGRSRKPARGASRPGHTRGRLTRCRWEEGNRDRAVPTRHGRAGHEAIVRTRCPGRAPSVPARDGALRAQSDQWPTGPDARTISSRTCGVRSHMAWIAQLDRDREALQGGQPLRIGQRQRRGASRHAHHCHARTRHRHLRHAGIRRCRRVRQGIAVTGFTASADELV